MKKRMIKTQKVNLSAANLADSLKDIPKKTLPPVEKWNPPFCGNLDIRISRNGTWFYLGTPIGRPELVKLFSSIIRKDQGKYFLVTPVEKVGIQVEDAPFVAVDFDLHKRGDTTWLEFTTNVGEKVKAGTKNPIRVQIDEKTQEPSPYILVRRNLEALIDRKSFYRLVDIGVHEKINDQIWYGVRSQDSFFPLILSKEIV